MPLSSCPRLCIPQSCLDDTRALLSEYSGHYSAAMGTARGVGPRDTTPSNITLLEGDFTDARWDDVSLVYAASRDFDDTVMLEITRRCLRLKAGARVVTLDKPLPSVLSDFEGTNTRSREEFQVAWQCQVEGGGGPAVAFVHHRVAPPA